MNRRGGFTLIELLVVIAIIALVMGIIMGFMAVIWGVLMGRFVFKRERKS